MKIKTSELIGPDLDWATGVAGGTPGLHVVNKTDKVCVYSTLQMPSGDLLKWPVQPSTDWSQGGPLIEQEEISVEPLYTAGGLDCWQAYGHNLRYDDQGNYIQGSDNRQYGPTPLIAAMRCYVASKLGNEIDIPEELSIIPPPQNPQSN